MNPKVKAYARHVMSGAMAPAGDAAPVHVHQAVEIPPLDKATAVAWVAAMRNTDPARPTGGRWTWEQTSALMAERGLHYNPADWYAALNMLYSDFGPLLAKHGAKELDAYVEMAKALLDDPDAKSNKMARYYRYIV